MKKAALASSLLFLTTIGFSWQVKLVRTISIDDRDLLIASCFAPLENGSFLFTDLKDKDHQIKVFDKEGKLVKAWGRMGYGPGEFYGAAYLDYQSPYLAVEDAGQHRVHVFEKIGDDEFRRIGECRSSGIAPLKIYRKNILLAEYIVSPAKKEYGLFMRDFGGKETKYVLPVENRFGPLSVSEHKRLWREFSGMSNKTSIDVYQDTAFYVSDVRLKVAKIDLRTMKTEFMGKEPRDFRRLVMDKKMRDEIEYPTSGKDIIDDIRIRHSFISGILADKDIVGILYENRDKRIDNELFCAPRIQINDHSGNPLHEQALAPFYSELRFSPYYYQKDKKRLYLLSQVSDESKVKFVIYEFALIP